MVRKYVKDVSKYEKPKSTDEMDSATAEDYGHSFGLEFVALFGMRF